MKCVNAKTTKLESSFATLREKPSMTTKWGLLLDAFDYNYLMRQTTFKSCFTPPMDFDSFW